MPFCFLKRIRWYNVVENLRSRNVSCSIPSKKFRFESDIPVSQFTQPAMLEYTERLMEVCRTLSPAYLSSLMNISDKLATLNANRFAEFSTPFSPDNARQAMYAFNGDVYTGLDAYSLDSETVEYAQKHLRILSGLYGLLRPLDLMQAYRLEMGTKLANPEGKDLYAFWDDRITYMLNKALEEQGDNVLINLASNEYFKAVKKKSLDGMIIGQRLKTARMDSIRLSASLRRKPVA